MRDNPPGNPRRSAVQSVYDNRKKDETSPILGKDEVDQRCALLETAFLNPFIKDRRRHCERTDKEVLLS